MPELTQIIKNNIKDGGKILGSMVSGVVQGLYFPAFINTSLR